jgi:hypothetical protein
MEMSFAPAREGGFEMRVPLVTSDPDSPTVYVTARGRGVLRAAPQDSGVSDASDASAPRDAATDARDGGVINARMEGGCGCTVPTQSTTPSTAATLSVSAGIALAFARRRRRRGDRTSSR